MMNKQRGGGFTVSGYVALALLALCVSEAAFIRHLYAHRVVHIDMMSPVSTVEAPVSDDSYVTHTFPPRRVVCSGFNTICYISI